MAHPARLLLIAQKHTTSAVGCFPVVVSALTLQHVSGMPLYTIDSNELRPVATFYTGYAPGDI